jgi:hypothetical protein
MNIENPRIQEFIQNHFANFDPKIYKLKITEREGMVVISYTNTKYNLSNTCYLAY